jgi:hypothetical protein
MMTTVTLYVDVENLMDIAKLAITSTIEQWPLDFPKPDLMRLYVRADQTKLWHIWASHAFPSIKISIDGVQRYGYGPISKNLADMSLVLDAITDLIKGRTTHVTILSDDSDYVALFSKIKHELNFNSNEKMPFMWFLTDRPDTHSQALNDFLPSSYLKTITYSEVKNSVSPINKEKVVRKPRILPLPLTKKDDAVHNQSIEEAIAISIIQKIAVGPFKSTDCRKFVQQNFREHSLAKADSPTFGNQFAKYIWPILERYGVRLPNPDKKPRKYEMTQEAKNNIPAN